MKIVLSLLRLLSRLPLRVLYVLSDLCYPVVRYLLRYRLAVVRTNLRNAFPELSEKERARIEKGFYRWFCDYVVETLKMMSMSPDQMRRRMQMVGVEEMEAALDSHQLVVVYLGHYCNWEWISSLPLWCKKPDTHCGQLYRPLRNHAFDQLFYKMRCRFGAENISKYDALRHIIHLRNEGTKSIIGFISDQAPGTSSIHDWVTFLHQDTPVVSGPERIARKLNAAVYFADVERLSRGHYRCTLRLMTDDARPLPAYALTEQYMQLLEQMIRRQPHLWLWSHRRWKHHRAADGTIID